MRWGSRAVPPNKMRIIAWNCRGLGNASVVHRLPDVQKRESPNILFVSETKMDKRGMERFQWFVGMPNMMVKDCRGNSGGLALFWRRAVDVVIRSLSKYHIDATVQEERVEWRITGAYGDKKTEEKAKTWRLLKLLYNQYTKPWLCLGDYNELLFGCKKVGGQPRSAACMERLRNTLADCNLGDLGFVGVIFTWRNHHHKAEGYIKERLDRAVANMEWRNLFPLVRVVNGYPRHSDHRPLIVECGHREPMQFSTVKDFSLKFEAKWPEEEDCPGGGEGLG